MPDSGKARKDGGRLECDSVLEHVLSVHKEGPVPNPRQERKRTPWYRLERVWAAAIIVHLRCG